MKYMWCYNKVKDFGKWKEVFDRQESSQEEAGLILTNLFQDESNPNDVYFIFNVTDVDKAKTFLADPIHEKIGAEAGVLDGYIKYVDEVKL